MSGDDVVYVLRTCSADMTASGGFRWPEAGPVEAPDWDPAPKCGHGLHGLLWGCGDGSLLSWATDARWLVVRVHAAQVVDLVGKVKFPRGEVVYCGDRAGAISCMEACAPHTVQMPVVGSARTSRDYGTSTSGYEGTSTSGDYGTSTSGDRGTSTSGYEGTSTSGYGGTSTSGDKGTSTSGYYGTSTSGDGGTSTSGYYGTSTSGDKGQSFSENGVVRSGNGGVLFVSWIEDDGRHFLACRVGEMGTKPNVGYRLSDDKRAFVKVEP